MMKLDIECCPICCAPVKAIETCNSVRFEYDGPRWINVEERLPEGKVIALCYDSGAYCYGEYIVGYVSPYSELEGVGFRAENDYELLDGVTHWMPLPELPKEAP